MRLEHAQHEHRTRQSTSNGSSSHSQNGSSPHAAAVNGSTTKNGAAPEMETNGFHHNDTNGHTNNDAEAVAVAVQRNTEPFHGHDREEVTRILLQSLSDLGYHRAAKHLSEESGYALEIPSVAAFRNAVLHGEWDDAEALLFGTEEMDGGVALGNGHSHNPSPSWRKSRLSFGNQNGFARHGLPLAEGADITALKFLLRQQKYLELLESRNLSAALPVLRNELTPLKRDIGRLHALSSLMMCQSASDLRAQSNWDGAAGQSRTMLLSEISRAISPSVMIPEHRLATLFTAVQQEQILSCRYHNTTVQPSLYTDHECAAEDFPLQPVRELRSHADEVWFVEFSHDGSMLATAGKDGLVCVYETDRWKCRHEFREHERHATAAGDRGVCCVAFSPDDQYLISCSQNNEFVVVNVHDGRLVAKGDHFDYPVTCAAWLPDSIHFVIGTQGSRRPLSLYSLRSHNGYSSSTGIVKNNEIYSWRDPPWDPTLKETTNPTSFRITDCAISNGGGGPSDSRYGFAPAGTLLAVTTIDNRILLYNLATRAKIAEWQMEDKLTSIRFDSSGQEMLINMNGGRILVLGAVVGTEAFGEVVGRYEGVVQEEFVVRSRFGGEGEGLIICGSEDSRVYIWRRQTGSLIAALDAHSPGTVNAVAWHPTNPSVFASAGDDRRVRIWAAASQMMLRSTLEATPGASASRTSLGYS